MNSFRVVSKVVGYDGVWFYPQYYKKPYLFGLLGGTWECFLEDGGCDPLGFDYGKVEVKFRSHQEANKYLKNLNQPDKIFSYENS